MSIIGSHSIFWSMIWWMLVIYVFDYFGYIPPVYLGDSLLSIWIKFPLLIKKKKTDKKNTNS